MKGGHGDNYYYQMVANIRRFKGARPIPPVEPGPVAIDGRFDDWGPVQPEFRDTVGDPTHRDHRGWGKGTRYANQTGRNDIVAAKVSVDETNISFHVRTRDELTSPAGPSWMLLFIDADNDPKTGWLGYDFVVNRKAPGPAGATIERNVGGAIRMGVAPGDPRPGRRERAGTLHPPRYARHRRAAGRRSTSSGPTTSGRPGTGPTSP